MKGTYRFLFSVLLLLCLSSLLRSDSKPYRWLGVSLAVSKKHRVPRVSSWDLWACGLLPRLRSTCNREDISFRSRRHGRSEANMAVESTLRHRTPVWEERTTHAQAPSHALVADINLMGYLPTEDMHGQGAWAHHELSACFYGISNNTIWPTYLAAQERYSNVPSFFVHKTLRAHHSPRVGRRDRSFTLYMLESQLARSPHL